MSFKDALKELLDNLDKVAEKHGEIHDTAVWEILTDAMLNYFVNGKSLIQHPLDNDFEMFTSEGNQQVYEALLQFLSRPEVKSVPVEATTPSERLAALQKRLDTLQDYEVKSSAGNTYEDYFAWLVHPPTNFVYPSLFRQTNLDIPGTTARFLFFRNPPPEHLISNINCVPFVGDQCVIIILDDGSVEIPGGTLEPGDDYETALRRELQEEAGANLLSHQPLGAWFTESSLPEPFRPHLPHPKAYRYVVYGDVELVSEPTNAGEQVAKVETVSVEEAVARFIASGRPDLAELYQLAAEVRSQRQGD